MTKQKPDWHRLTNKQTGETMVVAGLQGVDLEEYTAVKLTREPGEEDVCGDDGKVRKCPKKKAAREHREKWANMSREELGRRIEDLEARLSALEKAGASK